ncbi:Rpl10p [Glugoides intestinalis]
MAKLVKKTKEEKITELQKIKECLEKYSTLVIVENCDTQNKCLQRLRSTLDGKVIFAKKSFLQLKYPQISFEKNFFLVFINEEELKKLKEFEYATFLVPGDISPVDITIPNGIIRNKKLAGLLKPVRTQGAHTILLEDFNVVSEGKVAEEKACEILNIQGQRLAFAKLNFLEVMETKNLLNN